jgi:putative membrane protein
MNKLFTFLIVSFFAVLIWSVIHPYDIFTWFLEALPAMAAFMLLALNYKRFLFSNLVNV